MQHLKDYFSQFKIRWSDHGYHRMIDPMDDSRKYNMVVNFDYNFVQNWRSGYYNSIAGFISDFQGMSLKDAIEFVGDIDIPILRGTHAPDKFADPALIVGVKLPEEWCDLYSDNFMGDRCRQYLIERKLDLSECQDMGWGFCHAGEYVGRLIIPYKVQGKLVYYSGRSFIGGDPKYKNPRTEDIGVGKSEIFYNQDALYRFKEGWLLEGVIDAVTIGKNAIAASGWKLSASQISLIMHSRWKILNIIPDEGFELEAVATGLYFKNQMAVHIHKIPKGGKDVNQCGFNNVIFNALSL
jgi:hypothetical protein